MEFVWFVQELIHMETTKEELIVTKMHLDSVVHEPSNFYFYSICKIWFLRRNIFVYHFCVM